MTDQTQAALTLIERYGSFGLLCVIVLAVLGGGGLGLRYVAKVMIPQALAWLEKRDADHAAQLERRDVVCKTAAETSAKAADQVEKNTAVVAGLVAEWRDMKREK